MKKKKALTLIEVLIALSILTIVMGIVFPFFIRTFKGFNNTTIRSELQNEAEGIIREISKIAMEGKGVCSIKPEPVDSFLDSTSAYKFDGNSYHTIEIKSGEDKINKLYLDKEVLFKISETGTGAEIKKTIGEYVSYIDIAPLGGVSFKNSNGIKVVLGMKKKDVEYKISDIIYFRNKK